MKIAKLALLSLFTLCFLLVSQQSYARHAAILIDANNGNVLYELEPNQSWYPASLTKLMTLYTTFEALESGRLRLNQRLNVSPHAARQPTSKLGLRSWDTISTEDAIIAIITRSANDAAVVLAEAVGGTESSFAVKMTTIAHRLGMYGSHFMNATGLPHDWQTTTAHDMGLLAMRVIRDFPQYYGYFGMDSMYFDGRVLRGINKFVSHYPGAEGMKTGYTCGSGYNLVASANQYGKRLIGVVLGGMTSSERYEHMFMMMDMGFSNPYSYRSKNINTMSKNPVGVPPYQLSCGHRPTSHYAARSHHEADDSDDDHQIRYVKKYSNKPPFSTQKKPVEKILSAKKAELFNPKSKSITTRHQKTEVLHMAKAEVKSAHISERKSAKAKTRESSVLSKSARHQEKNSSSSKSKANTAIKIASREKTKGYYVPPSKETTKSTKSGKNKIFSKTGIKAATKTKAGKKKKS